MLSATRTADSFTESCARPSHPRVHIMRGATAGTAEGISMGGSAPFAIIGRPGVRTWRHAPARPAIFHGAS